MEEELQELATGPLDARVLHDSIPDIVSFFEALNHSRVRLMFGVMCKLPIDDLYQWHEMPIDQVESFIRANQESGVFALGGSDLFIENLEETACFLFCHESDLHFITSVPEHGANVLAAWKGKGFEVYASTAKRVGPGLGTVSAPRSWRKVS